VRSMGCVAMLWKLFVVDHFGLEWVALALPRKIWLYRTAMLARNLVGYGESRSTRLEANNRGIQSLTWPSGS
jgi:hypothetical protein